MLQRAANDAYSWWWASHIRTKQSKWLEQSLQDMEEKTQHVLSLIQEEGDSFAKRAEMYYKRRPEIVNYVEESYRAFRAVAERYDHISTEMQNANNTLATCFPEQFQMSMDEDDLDSPRTPRFPKQVQPSDPSKLPKVPTLPFSKLKGGVTTPSRLSKTQKSSKASDLDGSASKSGLSKSEAVDEIDKLQKDILALQTEKEFVKSSYQNGLEKFYSIENTIMEKQQRVSKLQDEFGVRNVIEDDEARKLMAGAALKSCQETLAKLQEKQQKSAREAKEEGKRIEDARQRITSIMHQYLPEKTDAEEKTSRKGQSIDTEAKQQEKDESLRTGDVAPSTSKDSGAIEQEIIQLQFDASSMSSITVTELAEKIDELVSKVIKLENSVSSQTILIERLRFEARELHANIHTMEDDKSNLEVGSQGLSNKVKELEEKLSRLQDLNQNVECENNNLESHFADAQSSLNNLSGKLSSVQPDEELDPATPLQHQDKSLQNINIWQENKQKQKDQTSIDSKRTVDLSETDVNAKVGTEGKGVDKSPTTKSMKSSDPPMEDNMEQQTTTVSERSPEEIDSKDGKDDNELNWQMMLLSGDEDREKILMKEYTTILKKYKDVKKKLNDRHLDASMQVKELKYGIGKRDEEIQKLRRKLNEMEGNVGNNMDANKDDSPISGPSEDQKMEDEHTSYTNKEEDDDFGFILSKPVPYSQAEEKLRIEIDSILDENLGFWLRFSNAFQQIQKFKTTVEDLEGEITNIREKQQLEDDDTRDVKSEVRPLYKHLKEIQAELDMWLEKSASLQEELEGRFSSLCSIQEKISGALKESVEEDDIKFSSHQAAKFQGEVQNMKQENNKVKEELQAGFSHIKALKGKVDSTVAKLTDEFGLAGNTPLGRISSRSKIPLQLFIFGSKSKQKKSSLFSRMHQNKKYQALRAGLPP